MYRIIDSYTGYSIGTFKSLKTTNLTIKKLEKKLDKKLGIQRFYWHKIMRKI